MSAGAEARAHPGQAPRDPIHPARRISRLLLPVFFLSGLSSLIYQVCWQRLLTLHYGVGSISITLIVSVYMLGLGLGALLGGQLSERWRRGLLAYFVLEIGIGAFGVASLSFLDALGRLTAGSGYALSFASMCGFLLLPTLLMGATLPLLVKTFSRLQRGFAESVSLLYFVNTLGAAVGAVVTAYGLITFGGLDVAIHAAAGINAVLALAVLGLDRAAGAAGGADAVAPPAGPPAPVEPGLGARVHPLVFVSGFLAIGYEIVWFRVIGVLIKASPYAFATILSVYLLGIAVGAFAVDRFLRRRRDVRRTRLFFALQLGIGTSVVALVAGFHHLARVPGFAGLLRSYFEQDVQPASWSLADLGSVFLWPFVFELLPTLLIGASFPLLACLALPGPGREGATVGRVYFTNTLGNLLGGVVTGFVLLAHLGSEYTLLCFASIHMALFLLEPRDAPGPSRAPRWALVGALLGVTLLVFPRGGELYRAVHHAPARGTQAFFEEGLESVVATFQNGPQVANYINGLFHGGRPGPWFVLETAEAMAASERVADVLVIGFGTGTITEAALLSEEVERLTLVELDRTLMTNLRKMPLFRRILADDRLSLVYDDGRRFLLRSDERFDLVLMDPLRTTTAYSNNLYSLEFFELVSRRLAPCGVFLLWTDELTVVPRTVAAVFPELRFYPLPDAQGFVLASRCPFASEDERVRAMADRAPEWMAGVLRRRSLRPTLDREALLRETAGAPFNRDWRPVSEYYLRRASGTGVAGAPAGATP